MSLFILHQKRIGVLALSNGIVCINGDESKVLCTSERVVCIAGTMDGSYLIVACANKQVKCFDLKTGILLGERTAARRPTAICLAENPTAILVACGGELYAMSLPTLDKQRWLLGHTSSILTAVRVCNGILATCDRNEKARISIWPQTAIIQSYCLGHDAFLSRCVFVNGNTRLVTCGGDGTLKLWNTTDGSELASVNCSQVLTCLDISPDNSRIAVAAEASSMIRLFDTTDLKFLRQVEVPSIPVDLTFVFDHLLLVVLDDPRNVLTSVNLGESLESPGKSINELAACLSFCATANNLTPHLKALHALDVPVDPGQCTDDNHEQQRSTPSILMKHHLPMKYDPSELARPGSSSKKRRRRQDNTSTISSGHGDTRKADDDDDDDEFPQS
mmetsp:Transcript_12501/g.18751  ORF Transcript_12501/g.18751 Transcript_12501/m.18751 type:complete len:389 (-) Transcript_12501:237-1403(-)